ncbi:hypothetical protein ABZ460_09835 [Streptomyces fagopyri]
MFQPPTCAPDLNPQKDVWSLAQRDLGNLAAADLGQITRAVKYRLKEVQYRPDLVDG